MERSTDITQETPITEVTSESPSLPISEKPTSPEHSDLESESESNSEYGDDLCEVLTGIFTTADGDTLGSIAADTREHLGNISTLLSNQNKILVKILQKCSK